MLLDQNENTITRSQCKRYLYVLSTWVRFPLVLNACVVRSDKQNRSQKPIATYYLNKDYCRESWFCSALFCRELYTQRCVRMVNNTVYRCLRKGKSLMASLANWLSLSLSNHYLLSLSRSLYWSAFGAGVSCLYVLIAGPGKLLLVALTRGWISLKGITAEQQTGRICLMCSEFGVRCSEFGSGCVMVLLMVVVIIDDKTVGNV